MYGSIPFLPESACESTRKSIWEQNLRASNCNGIPCLLILLEIVITWTVRKRASVRTEREKALSRLRSRPQPGALTLRISQENSIFSSSRKRRMGSLFSSPRTSCLDPFLIDHFPLLTSQGSVRRGLWSEIWCLVTTLRNLGWEEMGTWGASPSAFVSFTLRTGHLRTMFGAGHGKVGREMQTLPGKPGTLLNGARRLGGLGATQHHPNYPRVRSLCQSASSLP